MTRPPPAGQAEKANPDDPRLPLVLSLIRESFTAMKGRIDPPSSMHRLTLEKIREQCISGEVWMVGSPPVACVFLTPKNNALYLGKLAVADTHRGRGLARHLVTVAEERARALGKNCVELETRVELTENHQVFARLGFVKSGETSHPGYTRETSITMRKPV